MSKKKISVICMDPLAATAYAADIRSLFGDVAQVDTYVCGGCGYEYVPELGDEDGEIAPGTLFEQLPADWGC